MHPLMDMWSPSHAGFQEWDPTDYVNGARHILNESFTIYGVAQAIEMIQFYYEGATEFQRR
jgi:hypothetical protein